MTTIRPVARAPRGFTLIELLVVLGITGLLTALIVGAMTNFVRGAARREITTQVQKEARDGMTYAERGIIMASLGISTGRVSFFDAGAKTERPSVEVWDNVAGGGWINVKPNTDVLLLVRAESSSGSSIRELNKNDTGAAEGTNRLNLTAVVGFVPNGHVVVSDFRDASWASITAVTGGMSPSIDLGLGGVPGPRSGSKVAWGPGTFVGAGRALLYFVDTNDNLVRMNLAVPRAPLNAAEAIDRQIVARGFENIQIDCSIGDALGNLIAPVGPMAGDVLFTDAIAPFGAGTPRLALTEAGSVRTITMNVVARSRNPLPTDVVGRGDPPITLAGVTMGTVADNFVRRGYRLTIAVRNVAPETL